MTERFKQERRGQCRGPGKHVGHEGWIFDPDLPDDGCAACSWSHIEEFGDCEGIVEGLVFPNDPTTDLVDVRWEPEKLRYMYHPADLEVVSD